MSSLESAPVAEPNAAAGVRDLSLELEQLYRQHARPLLLFLYARCPQGDAEDVAQDVWLKVSRAVQTRFDGGNFRAWLFQIADNCLIDFYRRRRPVNLEDTTVIADGRTVGPADLMIDEERKLALESCLSRLNERERCVFTKRASGFDYVAIQSECGCDQNAAHKALHAAKQKLRDCLARKHR